MEELFEFACCFASLPVFCFVFTLKVHFKGFRGSTLGKQRKKKNKRTPGPRDATLHHMYEENKKTYSVDLNVRSVHLQAVRWRGENEIRPFAACNHSTDRLGFGCQQFTKAGVAALE